MGLFFKMTKTKTKVAEDFQMTINSGIEVLLEKHPDFEQWLLKHEKAYKLFVGNAINNIYFDVKSGVIPSNSHYFHVMVSTSMMLNKLIMSSYKEGVDLFYLYQNLADSA